MRIGEKVQEETAEDRVVNVSSSTFSQSECKHDILQVSIVILSYNRLSEISTNLSQLVSESRGGTEFQIIVVDNHSTDGTREFLREFCGRHPAVILVLNETNRGVGGGRNDGFVRTSSPFIVALDDDTSITAEAIRRVPELFRASPDTGLLAFRVVHPITGLLQNPHGNRPCSIANHHGAGFAFRREVYDSIGGIDENCDYGADELDLCIRIHAAGWKILYTPEITVMHNTLPRDTANEQWRMDRLIFNNVRLFYQYFPLSMARRHTWRHVLPQFFIWKQRFGLSRINRVWRSTLEGREAGLRAHRDIPAATVRYFADKRLRPEFGNVPLLERTWSRWRRLRHMRKTIATTGNADPGSAQDRALECAVEKPARSGLTMGVETNTTADVSVVILSHDRLSELKWNLTRLLAACRSDDEFQIIVVDNASTDGTQDFLRDMVRQHPLINVAFNAINKGVGGGRNMGYAIATRAFIVALDDDTAIAAEYLRRVPILFRTLPDAGLLAFRVVHPSTDELQNPYGDQPFLLANHHGAGFALRRELFVKLGGIDEECDYGAEELDFSIRVHAAGFQIRYTPEITVHHNSMLRDNTEESRRLARRIYNNVRVYYKYFPSHSAWVHSYRYAIPQFWNWIQQFGFHNFRCAWRAAWDGRSAGRKVYRTIPPSTLRYYSDRHLRPIMGNVPLIERVWQAYRHWRIRRAERRCKTT